MGMAASQARYLGLTARKTNVEYEGQQVNQQRTALANQSANLFNQLMKLGVPVPPSVDDYNKTIYSYNDGANTETITKTQPITGDPDYNYMVTHYHDSKEYTGIESIDTNPQAREIISLTPVSTPQTQAANPVTLANGIYSIQTSAGPPIVTKDLSGYDKTQYEQKSALERIKLADPTFMDGLTEDDLLWDTATGSFFKKGELDAAIAGTGTDYTQHGDPTEEPQYFVGNSQVNKYDPTDKVQKYDLETIAKDLRAKMKPGDKPPAFLQAYDAMMATPPGPNEIYTYEKNGKTYYVSQADLNTSINSKPGSTENQEKMYAYQAVELEKRVELTEKALIQRSPDGRMESIKYENSTAVYLLHTEIDKNDEGYNDAMNKYSYDVMTYQQKVEEVNTKTKVIQEQDRTLELRLKQLDTEQKALQTEMEAVAKVIQKNVETTFKTFS